jgi:multisubunit Na+/H+ antiporter MnhB subunit
MIDSSGSYNVTHSSGHQLLGNLSANNYIVELGLYYFNTSIPAANVSNITPVIPPATGGSSASVTIYPILYSISPHIIITTFFENKEENVFFVISNKESTNSLFIEMRTTLPLDTKTFTISSRTNTTIIVPLKNIPGNYSEIIDIKIYKSVTNFIHDNVTINYLVKESMNKTVPQLNLTALIPVIDFTTPKSVAISILTHPLFYIMIFLVTALIIILISQKRKSKDEVKEKNIVNTVLYAVYGLIAVGIGAAMYFSREMRIKLLNWNSYTHPIALLILSLGIIAVLIILLQKTVKKDKTSSKLKNIVYGIVILLTAVLTFSLYYFENFRLWVFSLTKYYNHPLFYLFLLLILLLIIIVVLQKIKKKEVTTTI